MKQYVPLLALLFLFSCATQQKANIRAGDGLEFLDSFSLPFEFPYKGTTVGGLSGIDRDARTGAYYLLSDDRSDINPARFYTADIVIAGTKLDTVRFTAVHYLKRANGSLQPNRAQDAQHTPDPEAIRWDAKRRQIVWSSEGERISNKDGQFFYDGAIYRCTPSGQTLDSFSLPAQFHVSREEKGPRRNGVFEGISFADAYKTLYVSVEEPLYNDGPRAGTGDSTGWIRIIRFDAGTGKPGQQFAYRIDPVVRVPKPASAFKINGVPDILWLGGQRLLVIERSFSTGWPGCSVRLYEADLSGATDVSGMESLVGAAFRPAAKRLLLNLDTIPVPVDNIEGAVLGPRLADGRQSLILVSDDNFSKAGLTQFLLFAIR